MVARWQRVHLVKSECCCFCRIDKKTGGNVDIFICFYTYNPVSDVCTIMYFVRFEIHEMFALFSNIKKLFCDFVTWNHLKLKKKKLSRNTKNQKIERFFVIPALVSLTFKSRRSNRLKINCFYVFVFYRFLCSIITFRFLSFDFIYRLSFAMVTGVETKYFGIFKFL